MLPLGFDPFWERSSTPLTLRRRALYEGLRYGLTIQGTMYTDVSEEGVRRSTDIPRVTMDLDLLSQRYLLGSDNLQQLSIFDVEQSPRIVMRDNSPVNITITPLATRSLPLESNSTPIRKVTWLPQDNGLIVVSHERNSILLLISESLALAESIRVPGIIYSHSISSKAHASLAVAQDDGASIIDLRAGCAIQHIGRTGSSSSSIRDLYWLPQEEFHLLLAYGDGRIQIWDIRKGPDINIQCPFRSSLKWVKPITDGGHVIASSQQNEVALISLIRPDTVWMQSLGSSIYDLIPIETTLVPLVGLLQPDFLNFYDLWSGEDSGFNHRLENPSYRAIFNPRLEELYIAERDKIRIYAPQKRGII